MSDSEPSPTDPLLEPDSFIHPGRNGPAAAELPDQPPAVNAELPDQPPAVNAELPDQPPAVNTELPDQPPDVNPELPDQPPDVNPELFPPGVVIAAEPISMYLPGDDSADATPRPVRRRNAEEMLKRPTWLPGDWNIDLKVRSSGATAGLIDRYYVEPTGQRRFRSKIEVLHFLETGSKLPKRKATSETETSPSCSPAKQSEKKSSSKRKKSTAFKSDSAQQRHANGVPADNGQQT